jgi:hypothetical protein
VNLTQLGDIIGFMGVSSILLAYFLLRADFLSSNSVGYSLINLLGSGMIMFSLFFHWNTPAVFMETAWMSISFYGIVKAMRQPATQ